MELLKEIGAFAGLVAFLGLALLALLSFSQARDIRRLREWAGSAPERDSERKETASVAATQRAEELRQLQEAREAERRAADLREERRRRREAGLPELTRAERLRDRFAYGDGWLAEPRHLVAVFVVTVLLGGAIAYVALNGLPGEGGGSRSHRRAAVEKPSEIEVTVLNGTAVPGLAARYGDAVSNKGFKLGAVTNSASSYGTSVVMFRRGNAPEGRRVARALSISRVRLMTSDIASVAAGAPVAVVIGEDNASSTG